MNRGHYTFVILKPDCLERNLVGQVLAVFEAKGLKVAALKYQDRLPRTRLELHYDEHEGQPYFPGLIHAMQAGPVVLAILTGPDAVATARSCAGHYADPAPGTIRARFRLDATSNTVHTSSSPEAAMREVALWFPDLLSQLHRLQGAAGAAPVPV